MSNLVVWHLVGSILISLLIKKGEYREANKLRSMGPDHPLVLEAEKVLGRLLIPRGGISCPRLEAELKEALKRDPQGLRAILDGVVENYVKKKTKRKYYIESTS